MLGKLKKDRSQVIKRRYRGKLIHQVSDEYGLIEVVDDATHRSLHFGTKEKQSAMDLKIHHALALSYTRTMMIALLFVEKPDMILNVGLGGGSIPKFLAHHYPECRIDIVELREAVVNTAYNYFFLPRDRRLNILISDIRNYLQHSKIKRYDLIVLDAFDRDGLSESVKGYAFLEACKRRLKRGGIMVLNLWSEPSETFNKMVYGVRKSFKNHYFVLPVSDRSNQILVARNDEKLNMDKTFLTSKARQLEPELRVGLPDFVEALISRASFNRN